MTTPDLLTTVGFAKTKIGSGDKEVGYQIGESSLCSLLGSILVCFGVMGLLTVGMVYDVHFEKRTIHRQLRQEEHHAATKLAEVQMELWSQYRDDIRESREAQSLLKNLDLSYQQFQAKIHSETASLANEFAIRPDKADKLADRIIGLVADMQARNVQHAKSLIDHLVQSGKKSAMLERRVGREIMEEAKQEDERLAEDAIEGLNVTEDEEAKGEEDPLRALLDGFWFTFNDYEREFSGSVRENFSKQGNAIYDSLVELQKKITSDNPISEAEVVTELDKVDLASVGAPLGEGRVLPPKDIVEELVLIPKIPHKELKKLKEEWDSGVKDTISVFEQLQVWHGQGLIPSGWLMQGVNTAEKEEFEEEEEYEKNESSEGAPGEGASAEGAAAQEAQG
mmetsp:Transcript_66891/g.160153  ORF Transcript_66891/g.160153 Transcript_66891/m.160153 type:complete len:395 (-) Transcript_66891:190-1374(-)